MNFIQSFTTQATGTDPSTRNIEIIPTPKWIRVSFGGELVADSKNVVLLLQKGRSPVYYFPRQESQPVSGSSKNKKPGCVLS